MTLWRLRRGLSGPSIARFLLIDRMQTRIGDLTHVGTVALGRMHAALFRIDARRLQACAPSIALDFRAYSASRARVADVGQFSGLFLEGWLTSSGMAHVYVGLGDMCRCIEQIFANRTFYFSTGY